MFQLSDSFVEGYKNEMPPFGYNGLGELVYKRTYARPLANAESEQWYQTCERVRIADPIRHTCNVTHFSMFLKVVNGTYTMQKEWHEQSKLPWREADIQGEAQEMYDRIFKMKFLPPGRGLWAMGTALTSTRKLYAALNNCAFVSTADLSSDPTGPFCFLMDASMLGVGVGFDTLGAGCVTINKAVTVSSHEHYIDDSREGWVESVRMLIHAYLGTAEPTTVPTFNYSLLRPKGAPIQGFGGTSQGADPLRQLHEDINSILGAGRRGKDPTGLTVTDIVDLMNLIGKCVVSGNVRRTAEIAFGSPDSEEYIGATIAMTIDMQLFDYTTLSYFTFI